MEDMKIDDDSDNATMERPPEVDVFSDFVMLVVPKLGQETARWKYDVWREEKRLTIFTLKYTDEMEAVAAVDDCLCLQFTFQPSDPSTYSLTPTFSSGGQKKDPFFIENVLGKSTLTSSPDVQILLTHLDNGHQTENPTTLNDAPSSESFSKFEAQVVPKFGQETGVWKYDVRREKKMLTIFRLGYSDNVAVVADCLSLHLVSNPVDLTADTFAPTLSSNGKIAEASYIRNILGKLTVTSAEDAQTILGHQDDSYVSMDVDKIVSQDKMDGDALSKHGESLQSDDDLDEWIAPFEEDSGDEYYVGDPENEEDDALEVDSSSLFRQPQRKTKASAVELQTTTTDKKRSVEESNEVDVTRQPKSTIVSKKRKVAEPRDERDQDDLFAQMCAASTLKLNLDDIPSLPVHEGCGGTILSSQYWTVPGASREKLNCTMDVFVYSVAMESLPNLRDGPEDSLADSVTYAWMLLVHLLGGCEAITRSFAYTTSGTCPIERNELAMSVVNVCDAVIEHMQRTFSLTNPEKVRAEILSMLKPLTSVTYKDQKSYTDGRSRFPSDIFLRDYLKESSHPAEGKVQVAHGFDFYVDEEKLREMEERYNEQEIGLPVRQRWCRFAMDIVVEMVGGVDVIIKGRHHIKGSTLALIGEDLHDATYERARKTFGSEEEFAYSIFRRHIQAMFCLKGRVYVEESTRLMASILFPSMVDASSGSNAVPALLVPEVDDPPAEPGCNYWTSPAPHRTRLSPNSDFYMLTARLVEYQRYLGPQRSKRKQIQGAGNREYTGYLKALVAYAVGGEGVFVKRLLQRRRAKKEGKTVTVLDEAMIVALFEHVELLYELPANTRKSAMKKLYDSVELYSTSLLKLYDKGETRWYFPEVDERPRPEAVALLEAQEYWRKPASDRTQLRPSHDVYITTKVLKSIASYFGPGSRESDIKKYSNALMLHMLGGLETAYELREGKTFYDGFRSMFVFDDLVAVCLHSDEVFQLMFSISPSDSLINATVRMNRAKKHLRRKTERKEYQPVKNTLYHALHV
ncbi:hypothetical protein RvY_02741 [Ramazzottius varieornatus]|uniref:Uncharacterized protein n=1 Tax=Ramazzottius varieornatus TaxID=947166 RepID=A0A1D1UKR6_RAMVA|nr:hypothetical protein RvY_02741 [Ramazzottius varieornatus]